MLVARRTTWLSRRFTRSLLVERDARGQLLDFQVFGSSGTGLA
jgi:hypothetical protein